MPPAPVVPATSGSTTLDDHLDEIAASPRGARRLALFDFDGTLIHGYSAFTFLGDGVRRGRVSPRELAQIARLMALRELGRARFEDLLALVTANLAGTPEAELAATGERLFKERIGGRIYEEARRVVDAHRARGHTVVVCSAATRQQLAPVARELGVEHVLATELEVADGVFSGRVLTSLWGDGKLAAATAFARRRRAPLTDAWFYSDGIEDLPLLERVGSPRPTNPDPELHRTAAAAAGPSCASPAAAGTPPATSSAPGWRRRASAPPRSPRWRPSPPRCCSRTAVRSSTSPWRRGATTGPPSPASTSGPPARSTCGRTARPCSRSTTRAGSTCWCC